VKRFHLDFRRGEISKRQFFCDERAKRHPISTLQKHIKFGKNNREVRTDRICSSKIHTFALMRRIILFISLFFSGHLLAQSTRLDTVQVLTDVQIVAKRTDRYQSQPVALSILDATQTQLGQPQMTLAEALPLVPGVTVVNADNFAQDIRLSIRGFGSRSAFGIRGVRLLVDGLPESTPDGQGQVDNIDPGIISQIEVLRGASAGLYGNAAGGVLRMTSDSIAARPALTAQAIWGGWGYQQQRLAASNRWGRVGVRLAGTHMRREGYRAQSATRATHLNGKVTFGERIQLIINYVDSPQADDPGGVNLDFVTNDPRAARPQNVQFRAGESVRQGKLGMTGSHPLSERQSIQWYGFGVFREFKNRLPLQNSGVVAFERQWAGAGVTYAAQPHVGDVEMGNLRIQLSYERQRDDRQRHDNLEDGTKGTLRLDQVESFANLAASAFWDWRPARRWHILAAARWDQFIIRADDQLLSDNSDDSGKSNLNNINPVFGINFRIEKQHFFYTNYSTAFETPTLTELANPALTGGFNPDLKPQRSQSVEAGFKGRFWDDRIAYDAALFRIVSDNEIVAFESPNAPGTTFYRNGGASRRLGWEAALQYHIWRDFSLQMNWNQADFQYITDSRGTSRLPGLPVRQGALSVQYTPDRGFYGFIVAQHTGQLWADDANAVSIDPVTLFSIRGGYRFAVKKYGTIEIFGGCQNLDNTRYYGNIRLNALGGRYYEAGAGRWGYLGLKLMVF
jgi:iron complex outermembrane recepter protein